MKMRRRPCSVKCLVVVTNIGFLYLVTFCVILPRYLTDKAYSAYFYHDTEQGIDIDMVNEAQDQNSFRLHKSSEHINRLLAEGGVLEVPVASRLSNKSSPSRTIHYRQNHLEDNASPSISVGVIGIQRSIEREQPIKLGYLTQVISTLDRLAFVDEHFSRIAIRICNVDINGDLFEEATRLSTIFDTHVKYKTNADASKFQEAWMLYEKEKQDYQFCLETSLSYRTDYVVLLEDDALPRDDFFYVLHQKLTADVYSRSLGTGKVLDGRAMPVDWGFMKLYYPERWAGYGWELGLWLELLFVGATGGISFLVLFTGYRIIATTQRSRTIKYHLPIFIIGVIYAIAVAKAIGRPYIIQYFSDFWGVHWVVQSRGCCTQATLFPSAVIPDLARYISSKECDIDYAIDHVLEDYKDDRDLKFYLVEPNLVRHIGMFSSLRSYAKRPEEFV